ncbi:MAG: preprotein translocase subunit SecG [Gammaproteobacteria bacterium]
MLFSILIAVMAVLGIVLVALILLQQGKGADAGAAFGSGASGTVFGSRGSGSFLGRTTGVLMGLFMILALVMAWLGQHGSVRSSSVMAAAAAASAATPVASSATQTLPMTSATSGAGAPARQTAPEPGSGGGA